MCGFLRQGFSDKKIFLKGQTLSQAVKALMGPFQYAYTSLPALAIRTPATKLFIP